jgi:hypothetical protein
VTARAERALSTAPEAPVEVRLATELPLKVAIFFGRDPAGRVIAMRAALGSGVEIVETVGSDDPRSFAELAQALRDAAPDVVLAAAEKNRDADGIRESLEALRFGCVAQRPPPRVIALAEPKLAERMRPAAGPFGFASLPDVPVLISSLRSQRRRDDANTTLRDEVLEDAARALAASAASDALVVDVSEAMTSCVLARADGLVEAVHAVGIGIGVSADRVVARAGIDRVRRWLPWPMDAPALLERVFNRARWPGALPASEVALAIEMALAREAIGLALREASAAGFSVAAMRAAPNVLVTGRAASFPRAAQTLIVAVDGLEPTGIASLWREPDEGHAERVALVASLRTRGIATLRFAHAEGREEQRVSRGTVAVAPLRGTVQISGAVRGVGDAGALGVVIDARGRPLALPHRDAERLPALGRWNAALGVLSRAPR